MLLSYSSLKYLKLEAAVQRGVLIKGILKICKATLLKSHFGMGVLL